jgi:hypothetical protein
MLLLLACLWAFAIPLFVLGLAWFLSRAPRIVRRLDRLFALPAREPDGLLGGDPDRERAI